MNTKQPIPKPLVLCILDGWGHREDTEHNAIAKAKTPFWDNLCANNPSSLLQTSGLAVGLPSGQMGNSEVGHMNIGSGRVVMQDLPRIDGAIENGSLAANPDLQNIVAQLKSTNGTCHIMGLVSDGGVHAHVDHIKFLANHIAKQDIKVALHVFTDGRDVPPSSAGTYIETLQKDLAPSVSIATVSGRYYAMDRDNRWDRVSLAYDAIVSGQGSKAGNAIEAVEGNHANGTTDEFIIPTVIGDYAGMYDGDALIMANFRADRARQILTALVDSNFDGFERSNVITFCARLGMINYSDALNAFLATLFPAQDLHHIFGEVLARHKLTQLRIAETEKYAHVTFFFNGGKEALFEGEERILVPSPDVATYDLKPEMSANEVTDRLTEAIQSGKFDVIIVNYANTDMVGHTGDETVTIQAVESIDRCLAKLVPAVEQAGGSIFITADHGNAEMMVDPKTGGAHTSHTTGPVPFVLAGLGADTLKLKDGRLCDIAPTLLTMLHIDQPGAMTGVSLIDD